MPPSRIIDPSIHPGSHSSCHHCIEGRYETRILIAANPSYPESVPILCIPKLIITTHHILSFHYGHGHACLVGLDGKPSSNNQPNDYHAELALAVQGAVGGAARRRNSTGGRTGASTGLGGNGSSDLIGDRGLGDEGAVGVDAAGRAGDHTTGRDRSGTGGEDGGGRERSADGNGGAVSRVVLSAVGSGEASEGGDDESLELHFGCLFWLFGGGVVYSVE